MPKTEEAAPKNSIWLAPSQLSNLNKAPKMVKANPRKSKSNEMYNFIEYRDRTMEILHQKKVREGTTFATF